MTRLASGIAALAAACALTACHPPRPTEPEGPPTVLSSVPLEEWVPIFNGKSLKGWRVPEQFEFESHGKIEARDDAIHLGEGNPFSAIAWAGEFPTENFEVELEAMRTKGADIFCGMTFPVGGAHVSLICGGWGDTVVGISSVDDMNASENETTKIMSFDNDKWYRIRARVTEARIEAWVDNEQVVELERKGHEFSLYGGIEPTSPFGIFTWQSAGALRGIRFRRLPGTPKKAAKKLPALPEGDWRPLFDGKTLGGWGVAEENEFALHGKVTASDGAIRLATGDPMTGIAWDREFPRIDYELVLDAMREEGGDFFCGLTFPVGKSQCTLICGGWGGSVVGLSNIDDEHAAENETTQSVLFDNGEWYRIRLRVTKARIEAWIDAKEIISLATKDRKLTIWPQQEPLKPLGIATYYTTAKLRNLRYRRLESKAE